MTTSMMTQLILPAALFCIMTGVGLSLKREDFYRLCERPAVILTGVILQLLLLPALAWLVVTLWQLPATLAAGLMVVALAPGGATSNMITLLARGDTALSVSLTAITSLLTPITMPLLTALVLWWFIPQQSLTDFSLLTTMLKLLAIAVVPVALGMLIRHKASAFGQRMQRPVRWLALLFLLLVVIGIMHANQAQLLSVLLQVGPAALLLMILALSAGYLIARALRFQPQQALTLAIETGVQNAGTALLMTAGILQSPQMAASALCYGVVMNLPVLLLIAYRNLPQRLTANG
ncbi:MAG: bile acid:sodium symporter [Marinobacterium sp.]|nr:bile acid:sodium symporter [Marinobacterium sp.]